MPSLDEQVHAGSAVLSAPISVSRKGDVETVSVHMNLSRHLMRIRVIRLGPSEVKVQFLDPSDATREVMSEVVLNESFVSLEMVVARPGVISESSHESEPHT